MSLELWKEFSLGEGKNPDAWGGIMYALKYSSELIEQKALQIATVLDGIEWLSIQEIDEGLRVDASWVQEESIARVSALLEEQSVLTDAKAYRKLLDDMNISSIAWLKDHVIGLMAVLNNENKVDLYNQVDMWIRLIVQEIAFADRQNQVLTTQQRKELQEVLDACNRFVRIAWGRTSIIG